MSTPTEIAVRKALPAKFAARIDSTDWSNADEARRAVDACDVVTEGLNGSAAIYADRLAREARAAWTAEFPEAAAELVRAADARRAIRVDADAVARAGRMED